jgi:hypothetical protein
MDRITAEDRLMLLPDATAAARSELRALADRDR